MRWLLVSALSLSVFAAACSEADPEPARKGASGASKAANKESAKQAPKDAKADKAGSFTLTYFNIPG